MNLEFRRKVWVRNVNLRIISIYKKFRVGWSYLGSMFEEERWWMRVGKDIKIFIGWVKKEGLGKGIW